MTSKSTTYEEELNKSLTQEERNLLRPIIDKVKEETKRKRVEEYKKKFLRTDLEEYNELLDENKELVYVLEQEVRELSHCKDKNREQFVRDITEGLKQDITRNVNIQTQLLERILNH